MESELERSLNVQTESNWVVSIFEILSSTPTDVVLILSFLVALVVKFSSDAYVKTTNKQSDLDDESKTQDTTIPLSAFMTLVNERENDLDSIAKEVDDLKKVDQIQNEIETINNDLLQIKEQLDTLRRQCEDQSSDPSPPQTTT